jgi:hypothetical protein
MSKNTATILSLMEVAKAGLGSPSLIDAHSKFFILAALFQISGEQGKTGENREARQVSLAVSNVSL